MGLPEWLLLISKPDKLLGFKMVSAELTGHRQRDLHLHAVAREQWVDVLPAQWRQVGAAGCR